jgi:hypothetical protein
MPIQRGEINFAVDYAQFPAKQLDAQICKNLYGTIDNDGKFKSPLFPFPGAELWADDSNNYSVRGMFSLNGILYAVVDNQLRTYDVNGGYKSIGTLNSSVGRVYFIANDTQVMISDGIDGYVYQLATTGTRTEGDFFAITDATTFIGAVTFSGSGQENDMTAEGVYTGHTNKTYRVQIDAEGSPDTFRWSDDGGITWSATGVTITGDPQLLNDGVSILFIHGTGHTKDDYWDFNVSTYSSFFSPIIPAYIDTYGIFPRQNSKRFYITQSEDFSQVEALSFAQANAWPDDIVAAVSVNQELTLLCQYTSEFWYDTGASPVPFQRRPNLLIHYGCAAPYSVAVGSNKALFFLGQSKNGGVYVMVMMDYQAAIMSNEALNIKLKELTKIDDAFGYVMEWDGHIFYFITFPTEDLTYVYDFDLKRWYQRTSRRLSDNLISDEYIEGRYFANCYIYHAGMGLVGDYASGKIYKLSKESNYDKSIPITCEAITAPLHINLDRATCYSLQVDFESATSDLNGAYTDASVMLQYSKDGGYTWSKEMWRGLGKTGEYNRRVKWNIRSTGRGFVFRIRVTDPVYRVLLGGIAEFEDTGS